MDQDAFCWPSGEAWAILTSYSSSSCCQESQDGFKPESNGTKYRRKRRMQREILHVSTSGRSSAMPRSMVASHLRCRSLGCAFNPSERFFPLWLQCSPRLHTLSRPPACRPSEYSVSQGRFSEDTVIPKQPQQSWARRDRKCASHWVQGSDHRARITEVWC